MDLVTVNFGKGLNVVVPDRKLRPNTILYLAGALGFAQATVPFQKALEELVDKMGGTPLNPWKITPPEEIARVLSMPEGIKKTNALKKLRKSVGRKNSAAIKGSTGMIVNLDGSDVDSGSAAEVGAANILGMPVLGYRGDFRNVGELGGIVNVQLEFYIEESNGDKDIVRDIHNLPEAILKIWG